MSEPRTTSTSFHADLSDAHPGEEYWLHACGRRHELVAHDAASRAEARAAADHLADVPDERLTHYTATPVELPAECVVRVHLKHTMSGISGASGGHGVSHAAIHCPPPESSGGAARRVHHPHIDYVSTAKALVFHHADLITNDPETACRILNHMDRNKQIRQMFETLGERLKRMGPPAPESGWARLVPFTPKNEELGYDGSRTFYYHQPTREAKDAAGAVMTAVMKATKNDPDLRSYQDDQGKWHGVWQQTEGRSVEVADGTEPMRLVAELEEKGDDWTADLADGGEIHGLTYHVKTVDSDRRQVKLRLANTYIRYLAAYIRFYDAEGRPMYVPDWTPDETSPPDVVAAIFGEDQYEDLRYLGYVSPVDNLMAVPITSLPGELEVTLTFPEDAVRAHVYGSGLGTGSNPWPKSPVVGGILTGLLNLGVPAFLLGFQVAAQSYKPLYDIVESLMKKKAFIGTVIVGGGGYFVYEFGSSAAHGKMNWQALTQLISILFDPAATEILLWVEAQIVAGELEEEIPFAGWIVTAIDIATDVAQIAETITAVATSPWNIRNQLSTTITTRVSLHPDPRHQAFPQGPAGSQASYAVKMIYRDQSRPTRSFHADVAAGSTEIVLDAVFPGNTLGGEVKFEADYYLDDWRAGMATTGWLENDERHVEKVVLYLVQRPIPLSEKSIYLHTSLLTWQDRAYKWQPTPEAPKATLADADTSGTGNAISVWNGLSLSQRYAVLGWAWKAAGTGLASCTTGESGGQLYAMQSLDIPGRPVVSAKFPACGCEGPAQLIYDPYPPKFEMKDGNWVLGSDDKPVPDPSDEDLGDYYVDPRRADESLFSGGGYHLRKVVLDADTPFDMAAEQRSHGRFPYFPTSFSIHPAGYVIAVTSHDQINKLQITPLAQDGAADDHVPVARTYAGQAFRRDRPGLLFHPVAVTCSYDGTVLVLEDAKAAEGETAEVVARIQAFDLYGNPVNRFFDEEGSPSPFLPLDEAEDHTYLDVAAVGDQKMTYVYVLYYAGSGSSPDDYHMAIYQYGRKAPKKNPLVTTDGVAAAKLIVDMWHTAYTLNYAMTTDGAGQAAGPEREDTGPAGRTVPSLSEWLPPLPDDDS